MKKTMLWQLLLLLVLAGCTSNNELPPTETYYPFQNEEGLYGLIDEQGKVVVEPRFTTEPCMAQYNRFWVYNQEEMYELYTVEATPRLLGAHRQATVFNAPTAAVCDDNGYIQLIDVDNKVVKTLDQIGGKAVALAVTFPGGLFRIQTDDDLYGVIDAEGNVVVEPEYAWLTIDGNGDIMAVGKEYKSAVVDDTYTEEYTPYDTAHIEITMMDNSGKVVSVIDTDQYKAYELYYYNGLIKVATELDEDDEPTKWTLIQPDGTLVFEANRGEDIVEIADSMVVVSDGMGDWGVRSFDGETIVEIGDYYSVSLVGKNGWLAVFDDAQSDGRTLINRDGRKKYENAVSEIYPFIGNISFIKLDGEDSYRLINADGELVETTAQILDMGCYTTIYEWVRTAHLDTDAFVEHLKLTEEGMLGLNRSMLLPTLCKQIGRMNTMWPEPQPFLFNAEEHSVPSMVTIDGVTMDIGLNFDSPIVEYSEDDEPIAFNDLKPILLGIGFDKNEVHVRGNETKLLQALKERVKQFGTVEEETDNAVLVWKDDNWGYLVAFDGMTIVVLCGEKSEVNYSLEMFNEDASEDENYSFYGRYISVVG